MRRYYPLSSLLRRRLGGPARKIPLDGPFSCPNRDGTLSRAGCAFCNPRGAGTGLRDGTPGLREQWDARRGRASGRRAGQACLAYLQSHSNTHGPLELLRGVLDEIKNLPDVAGLCLGTRPDCLDRDKLEILAKTGLPYVQLDLGLQSADDAVLAAVNRGHTADDFARAAEEAAAAGIAVCAHVMAGLPNGRTGADGAEGLDGLLETIDFLNGLPVSGIKLHNTLVVRGTALARRYRRGEYVPPDPGEYAIWAALALARLRPDIAVQRLCAEADPAELLAPAGAGDAIRLRAAVVRELEERDLWQGRDTPWAAAGPAPWFAPDWPGPELRKTD